MTKPREPVDMSPQAVANRLEVVRALYKLCMSLKRAGVQAGMGRAPSLLAPPPPRDDA